MLQCKWAVVIRTELLRPVAECLHCNKHAVLLNGNCVLMQNISVNSVELFIGVAAICSTNVCALTMLSDGLFSPLFA